MRRRSFLMSGVLASVAARVLAKPSPGRKASDLPTLGDGASLFDGASIDLGERPVCFRLLTCDALIPRRRLDDSAEAFRRAIGTVNARVFLGQTPGHVILEAVETIVETHAEGGETDRRLRYRFHVSPAIAPSGYSATHFGPLPWGPAWATVGGPVRAIFSYGSHRARLD